MTRYPNSPRRRTPRAAIGVAVSVSCLVVFACSDRDVNLGFGVKGDAGSNVFVTPVEDAAPEAEPTFTLYCASSRCPTGRTTCPASRFKCDVDLRTDRENCGACGHACPSTTDTEIYECVDGKCVMGCTGIPPALDCDGLPDNGCEIRGVDDDHCGACGNECTDPAKPCVQRSLFGNGEMGCGCKADQLYCTTPFKRCVDGNEDDDNCGACGNTCDPNGDGGAPHSTMYYGCYAGECGHAKCKPNLANCDGDDGNGCETSILTRDNCGGCGVVCAEGQECRLDSYGTPQCMCPPGETFCPTFCVGDLCQGACYNLSSDRNNCGACGASCSAKDGNKSIATCNWGICTRQCAKGWADCNGNDVDDCEVDTDSDPANCGGCGITCDGVAGQACVGGRCVVEPCDRPASDGGQEVPQ